MTFPTTATTTTSFGTAATSHLVNMPATTTNGDLLLMFFYLGSGAGGVPTPPTGWTKTQLGILQLFWTVADGTEGGTTVDVVTSTSAKAAAIVHRVQGWRNSGTIFTANGNADQDLDWNHTGPGGSQPDPPSLTVGWSAEDELWLTSGCVNTSSTISSFPTNYTSGVTVNSGGGGNASTKVCGGVAQRNLNATTDDPGAFTFGTLNTDWDAFVMSIRPAAAAAERVPYIPEQMPSLLAQ